MSDFNFADLAQVRVGDVEPPKPIPDGFYKAVFTGPHTTHTAKSGNGALRFPFKLIEPGEEIDLAALETAGGLPEKSFNLDFWMSPDARYRFTDFGKAMGASDDLNIIQMAEWLVETNEPFMIQARQEANQKDPSKTYTNFDNPRPVA